MKDVSMGSDRKGSVLGAAVFWMAAVCAWGGIAPPFYVGNLAPVQDEYGRPMRGSRLSSDAASRPRVELRVAPGWQRVAPTTTGGASPLNPLVTEDSHGGIGLNAAESDSGLFCMVFPQRPPTNLIVFARAYNAPTAAEATFYADSFPVRIPAPAGESSLVLAFEPAKPLDPGDDDADGLTNSWEKLLGTDDRPSADYDGDGMLDLHEMLAGTDPTDPGSLLVFRSIRREDAPAPADAGEAVKSVRIRWQSVPGRRYQLQYVPTLLGAPIFIPIGEVVLATEGASEMEMLVDLPEDAVAGTFRIRLVRE